MRTARDDEPCRCGHARLEHVTTDDGLMGEGRCDHYERDERHGAFTSRCPCLAFEATLHRLTSRHTPPENEFTPGRYQHYKGGYYRAERLAYLSESRGTAVVVYTSEETGATWVRPWNDPNQDSWTTRVVWPDGEVRTRFVLVEPRTSDALPGELRAALDAMPSGPWYEVEVRGHPGQFNICSPQRSEPCDFTSIVGGLWRNDPLRRLLIELGKLRSGTGRL